MRLPASVGVDAARSATRSSSGVSVSWPIALTTGVRARDYGAQQRLVAERQQVLDAAAAAGDDDDVDRRVGIQPLQRGDDLVDGRRALRGDVLDAEPRCRAAGAGRSRRRRVRPRWPGR